MNSFVITNTTLGIVKETVELDGTEANMAAIADKLNLPLAKCSFIRLAVGQSLVLRAEAYAPLAA